MASEDIVIGNKYETLLRRLAAILIDTLLFLPLFILQFWIEETYHYPEMLLLVDVSLYLPCYCYSVIFKHKYGCTLGKWIMKLQVVDLMEQQKITLLQAILRDSLYLLMDLAIACYYFILMRGDQDQDLLYGEYSELMFPICFLLLVDCLFALSHNRKRALHDIIAGTVVVKKT